METQNNALSRKRWKLQITRGMYEKGFTEQNILNIFNFIDWVMKLPPELEEQFSVELETYEQERKMPYVTSIERRGIEKGRQEGWQEAESNTLLMILRKRLVRYHSPSSSRSAWPPLPISRRGSIPHSMPTPWPISFPKPKIWSSACFPPIF